MFNVVVVGDVSLLAGVASCGRLIMSLLHAAEAAKEFTPAAFSLVRTAVVPQRMAAEPLGNVTLA